MVSALLSFLKQELACPRLRYERAPHLIATGTEAQIIGFSVAGAERLRGPMVLRLSVDPDYPLQPMLEHAVHQAVIAQGFPAPPVHFFSNDGAELGRPFLIMADMTQMPSPGWLQRWTQRMRSLLRGRPPATFGKSRVKPPELLVKLLASLHELDGEPLLKAFATAGVPRPAMLGQRRYQQTLEIVERWELRPLQPLMKWLQEGRPALKRPSICHGDPHVGNLILSGSHVNAMIDWSGAQIGDPEADLGLICGYRRCHEDPAADPSGTSLDRDLLDSYGRCRGYDEKRVRYYEAELLISFMASVGDQVHRRLAQLNPPPNPILDDPRTMGRLGARLRQIVPAGVTVPLSWV